MAETYPGLTEVPSQAAAAPKSEPGRSTSAIRRGWLPDKLDNRDQIYSPQISIAHSLPESVDLRASCPPMYEDQIGGTCTAYAVAAAVQFANLKAGLPAYQPSALYIYFFARVLGQPVEEEGCSTRDAIKAVNRYGAPPEYLWPNDYDPSVFPDPSIMDLAGMDMVTSYARVPPTLGMMRSCLAEGYPFVFGIPTFGSWQHQTDIPMPASSDAYTANHAMLAVGYDDRTQRFVVRNSWGLGWGDSGYGTIPYDYLIAAHAAKIGEAWAAYEKNSVGYWMIRKVKDELIPMKTPAEPATVDPRLTNLPISD
jgi:hypothetical protein